ncbi:hypothetical protein EDB89DRAFT_1915974 [Lactarius sanguifluus]|nr:hypothetical protein EDB89DRAFT_1915974 [Lactarius sanguifluus]
MGRQRGLLSSCVYRGRGRSHGVVLVYVRTTCGPARGLQTIQYHHQQPQDSSRRVGRRNDDDGATPIHDNRVIAVDSCRSDSTTTPGDATSIQGNQEGDASTTTTMGTTSTRQLRRMMTGDGTSNGARRRGRRNHYGAMPVDHNNGAIPVESTSTMTMDQCPSTMTTGQSPLTMKAGRWPTMLDDHDEPMTEPQWADDNDSGGMTRTR